MQLESKNPIFKTIQHCREIPNKIVMLPKKKIKHFDVVFVYTAMQRLYSESQKFLGTKSIHCKFIFPIQKVIFISHCMKKA